MSHVPILTDEVTHEAQPNAPHPCGARGGTAEYIETSDHLLYYTNHARLCQRRDKRVRERHGAVVAVLPALATRDTVCE